MDAPSEGSGEDHAGAQQLRLVYETARALAESSTLAEAAPRMLESICRALGWEHGALWSVDKARMVLRCVANWHQPTLQFDEFTAMSQEVEFASGVGLPGRVWAARQSAWIPDVVHDSNFPRASLADRAGLHSALGFPILRDGEVLGVMEFFSREIRQPDDELLATLTTVGQPGRPVRRPEAGRRGDGPLLHPVARPLLHRQSRRLLPPPESRVGTRARHSA